jgi:hypothetical protein
VAAVFGGTALLASEVAGRPDLLAPLGIGPSAAPTGEQPEPSASSASSPAPPPPPASGPQSAGSVPATTAPTTATTTPPTPTTPARPPAAPARLAAQYGAVSGETSLVGYGAAITVSNAGAATAQGWTVVLTLPRPTLQITDVRGATVTRDGAVWTFTPDNTTRAVAAGASKVVRFVVGGAPLQSTPTACTIDGAACTIA